MNGFPKDVEIWSRRGDVAKKIADVASSEGIVINGVQPGPRGYRWRPDQPATITWVEALDGGNPKNVAPFRDKVLALAAPFSGTPIEVTKTEWRFGGLSYTEKGIALLVESDRTTRRNRTWILEAGAEPRKLWERRQQDSYNNPGTPVVRRDSGGGGGGRGGGGGGGFGGFGGGGGLILQRGDSIYLAGQGASSEGDRPFLDRLDLKTLKTERLFRCADKTYETVVAPLDDDAKTLLTEYETSTEPPNYYVRDLASGTKRAITQFKDPAPQLAAVEKQFVTYARKDGVKLSGTLYLPPGYKKGERLPMLMWAYPREFTDADSAESGLRLGASLHQGERYITSVSADPGLRDLRQSDYADYWSGRDGERHLRGPACCQRSSGSRQGGRDGRRGPRPNRGGWPQLRRVHDGQSSGALGSVPHRHRAERGLQSDADALRVPE